MSRQSVSKCIRSKENFLQKQRKPPVSISSSPLYRIGRYRTPDYEQLTPAVIKEVRKFRNRQRSGSEYKGGGNSGYIFISATQMSKAKSASSSPSYKASTPLSSPSPVTYIAEVKNMFMKREEEKTERSISQSLSKVNIDNYKSNFDNLEVERDLKSGGYGAVSLVKWNGKRYIQKRLLKKHLNTPERSSLLNEMRCIHLLRDTGIAPRLIAYEEIPGSFSFLMEYHEGYVDLMCFLKSTNILPYNKTKICANILNAFSILHGKTIVHNDVKPNNIIVNPKTLDIKIIDFGLSFLKETRKIGGSVTFACPQKLNKGVISYGTDCWSLGLTFLYIYYMYLPTRADAFFMTTSREYTHIAFSRMSRKIKYGTPLITNIIRFMEEGFGKPGKTAIKRLISQPTVKVKLYNK
jgi:tRNA A-37 threonylcarbamoyl transferase component Bud32